MGARAGARGGRGGYLPPTFNWTAALRPHPRPFFPRSDERVSNVRSLFLGRGAHAARRAKGRGSRISNLPVSALLLVNAGEVDWDLNWVSV